jgi:hypothetical protein
VDADYLQDMIQPESAEPPKPTLVQLAAEMKSLKTDLDDLEETRKPIQARYDEIRKKLLPDAMVSAGVSNFKLTDGGTVYITNKISASVREDDRPRFFNWLRDNGHAGLITPNVHPATLTAWAKEQLEAKRPVSPFIRLYEEPMASIRGAKKS